ncbi:MAG TPA: mitochondrial fission ELM1 family protein [Aliidongia sp.]|nr:mitochondrial fission ELM1 family protein [Aliidongia sp.]
MSAPVWVLYDGKDGLRSQVMGVAEAVGLPFEEKRLETRYPWKVLPPSLWPNARHAPGRGGDRLLPPWPRLIICAGGRASAPSLSVRKAARGRCLVVQIQDPKIAPRHFDLMLIPEHDKVRAPNIMVTRGAPHRVTPQKLAEAAGIWGPRLAHLGTPRVAVLIGGDNGAYRLNPPLMARIANQLAVLAEQGAGLMITPSRRTGEAVEQVLRARLAKLPVEIWNGAGDNPYFGYLALADHVLATADSISMITEASATGKPVHVIPLEGGARKFEIFHQAMREAGVTRPFAGALDSWTYQPRDDTAEAGERIRALMRERDLWP